MIGSPAGAREALKSGTEVRAVVGIWSAKILEVQSEFNLNHKKKLQFKFQI